MLILAAWCVLGSSLTFSLIDMSKEIEKWATQEREYIRYKDKFVKRSLAPDEYNERIRGVTTPEEQGS